VVVCYLYSRRVCPVLSSPLPTTCGTVTWRLLRGFGRDARRRVLERRSPGGERPAASGHHLGTLDRGCM